MTFVTRLLLFFVIFSPAGTIASEDYNAIFERAVNAIDFNFDKSWAYTETQVGAEHVWVGRFDPRHELHDRWQLISIDGREPTEKEIKEYRKEKRHDHSDDNDNRVEALVEPDSIRLIEQTDDYWLLGFTPDDEEKILDSVDATIRVNKTDGHLEYIDLRNHSPIKPAIGVKIAKLITRLTFGPATEDGPMVPLSTHVEAKGRAFLFVSFDEKEVYRNSEFVYVGEE